jgi:transposase
VEVVDIEAMQDGLCLSVKTCSAQSCCPCCGQSRQRIHSHYERRLKDLACSSRSVEIVLKVRRFFGDNTLCERRIFTEQLGELVAPHARRTRRVVQLMQEMGLLVGGTASVKLLGYIAINTSRWTVLRDVRKVPLPSSPTPRVLGVDDWALRRGHCYGTILVDMETAQVIDLLADREAITLATWLQAHPGVEIISRDRAGAYADGAKRGAPQAIQVADRGHLLRNLADALTNLFGRHRRLLKQLDAQIPPSAQQLTTSPAFERRLARFERVRQLREDGLTISALAALTQLDRKTIRKYLNTERLSRQHPARQPSQTTKLSPYREYLLERGLDGQRTVRQLWRELAEQGFTGSLTTVATFLAAARHPAPELTQPTNPQPPIQLPAAKMTPRRATWLLLARPDQLTPDQLQYTQRLIQLHPDIAHFAAHAQAFAHLLRQQTVEAFDSWLQQARQSYLRELRTFAHGFRRDYFAVKAAIALPWSNGLVEGFVNLFKFVKRQMFGRARFDLLRIRVLLRAFS